MGLRIGEGVRRHDPFEAVLVTQVEGGGHLVPVVIFVGQHLVGVALGVVVVHERQGM